MDLLEQTRRDDTYNEVTRIIDAIGQLSVFPSLVWVWAWDNVADKLDYYTPDSGEGYITNPEFTEKDVWDLFWDHADTSGFSLEFGAEYLDESIFDWMIDNDILIEETELDEEEDVVVDSAKEEV